MSGTADARDGEGQVGLLAWALKYAEWGWYVFPCAPGEKQPLIKAGLNSATRDASQIRAWWQKWPGANIGVACGPSGLVVLDIDHGAGSASWEQLQHVLGPARAARVVHTPRGGWHEYFAATPGAEIHCSTSRLARNVDVRAVGGYVLAPPSVFAGHGAYAWVADRGARGPDRVPLAPLPPQWVAALVERRRVIPWEDGPTKARVNGAAQGGELRPAGAADLDAIEADRVAAEVERAESAARVEQYARYARRALEREAAEVGCAAEGVRNDRLNRAAYSLGQLVTAGVLCEDDIWLGLTEAARRCGLGEREAVTTIASGIEAGRKKGRKLPQPKSPPAPRAARPATLQEASDHGGRAPKKTQGARMAVDSAAPTVAPGQDVQPAVNPVRFPCTDAGNGELLVALYGDRLRYNVDRSKWLLFTGHRWRECAESPLPLAVEAARLRKEVAAGLADAYTRAEQEKWARGSENVTRMRAAFEYSQKLPAVCLRQTDLDTDPYLLGCTNGVLELKTGTLRPGRPEDLITQCTGVAYDPAATAPRWERFLAEIACENLELIALLSQAMGYTLTGDTREQRLFICLGEGANGKSTFLNVLTRVLGDYAAHAPDGFFEEQPFGDKIGNDVAMLVGKRLVTASETAEHHSLNERRVKAVTGGDPQTGRFLYREHFTYSPTYKPWLATNHMPKIRGREDGIWRRLTIIEFGASFQGCEDRGLAETLAVEAPGILAWAVRACLDWQRDGLRVPEAVHQATASLRVAADSVQRFMQEEVTRAEGCELPAVELYREYRLGCLREGEDPVAMNVFGARLKALGYAKRRITKGNVYCDLALVGEPEHV